MHLEDIILSEVTQSQKNTHDVTDKQILAQKLRLSKIQFAKYMKLKKKEDQSVDTFLLLRMGNKIPMEGVTETKVRAETECMTIQRLPCMGNPSYKQRPKTDTIVEANKSLLTGA